MINYNALIICTHASWNTTLAELSTSLYHPSETVKAESAFPKITEGPIKIDIASIVATRAAVSLQVVLTRD